MGMGVRAGDVVVIALGIQLLREDLIDLVEVIRHYAEVQIIVPGDDPAFPDRTDRRAVRPVEGNPVLLEHGGDVPVRPEERGMVVGHPSIDALCHI